MLRITCERANFDVRKIKETNIRKMIVCESGIVVLLHQRIVRLFPNVTNHTKATADNFPSLLNGK